MTFSAPSIPIVIDASVAVEQVVDPWAPGAMKWRAWAAEGRLRLVPTHFWAEVANALLVGQRLDVDTVRDRLRILGGVGLENVEPHQRRLLEAIGLASQHRLSAYDALYVQLAIETDATLATFDAAMRRAAEAEGIEVEALD